MPFHPQGSVDMTSLLSLEQLKNELQARGLDVMELKDEQRDGLHESEGTTMRLSPTRRLSGFSVHGQQSIYSPSSVETLEVETGSAAEKHVVDRLLIRAKKKFNKLDTNGNGVLDGDEITGLAQWVWSSFHPGGEPLSNELIAQESVKLLGRLDANGDSLLAFDEFADWFRRTCASIERYRRGLAQKNMGRPIKPDPPPALTPSVPSARTPYSAFPAAPVHLTPSPPVSAAPPSPAPQCRFLSMRPSDYRVVQGWAADELHHRGDDCTIFRPRPLSRRSPAHRDAPPSSSRSRVPPLPRILAPPNKFLSMRPADYLASRTWRAQECNHFGDITTFQPQATAGCRGNSMRSMRSMPSMRSMRSMEHRFARGAATSRT